MSSSLELECSEPDSLPIHRFCVYLQVTSHARGVVCLNTISLKKVSSSHVDSQNSLSAVSRTVHADTFHCIPYTMNSFLILGTSYVHIWNLLWKHLSKAPPRRLYKVFPWKSLNCCQGRSIPHNHHKQFLNLSRIRVILRLTSKTFPRISWPWSSWCHVSELRLKKPWAQ